MGSLGLGEILLLIAIVSILFFGGKKIEEVARSLGKFTGEFKKGKAEVEKEIENIKK